MSILLEVENNLKAADILLETARREELEHNTCLVVGLRALGGDIGEDFLRERKTEGYPIITKDVLSKAGALLGFAYMLKDMDDEMFLRLVNHPDGYVQQIVGEDAGKADNIMGFEASHLVPGETVAHAMMFGRLDGYKSAELLSGDNDVFIVNVGIEEKPIGYIKINNMLRYLRALDSYDLKVKVGVIIKNPELRQDL